MLFARFQRASSLTSAPVIATAVHNGHDLRPEILTHMALDSTTRLREEDPFTDFFAAAFPASAIVYRSRFEVDVNRLRESAIYGDVEDAWGLEVWKAPLPPDVRDASLTLYDRFFADLESLLDEIVGDERGFVLYDIHSYNHRRGGPDEPPAPAEDNPVVNLGTGSLPAKWRDVADSFVNSMAGPRIGNEPLDIRENVKFRGRQVAAWVHEHYGDVGCALAIELKKVWMDEWSGQVDPILQSELRDALVATIGPVTEAWRACGSY